MAESNYLNTITMKAAADLRRNQYHFVRISAARTVNVASQSTAEANFGVLQNKPEAANRAATVGVDGFTQLVAGGAITQGVLITTNGSGRAAAHGSGDMVMGRAIDAAGNDGEIIMAQIFPPYYMAN